MRVGPVDLGSEHRGGAWDIGVRFFPGSILLLGIILLFERNLFPIISGLIDMNAFLSILVLIIVAYLCGHVVCAITDSLGKWTDAVDKGRFFQKILIKKNRTNPVYVQQF
jgi:hypothetical protein